MSSASKTVKFVAAHTNTVNASPSSVWAIWSDVSKWHALDTANRKATIKGAFAPGSVVTLGLKDGNSVEVVLKTVTENKEFSDETTLPSGIIRTTHKMEQSGDNLIVTYYIEAEVAAADAQAFSAGMWQNLIEGVPSQVGTVAALARAA
ncbi:SRPBCC family protein [Rhizobium ruizarguesonis]